MFEDMAELIAQHELHPVVDDVFDFAKAKNAYRRMRDATHLGKLVICVDG